MPHDKPTDTPVLTNCHHCLHAIGSTCAVIEGGVEGGALGGTRKWVLRQSFNSRGMPRPSATGCPGFTPKVVAS